MGSFMNPGNKYSNPQQAAMYYARRRRLALTVLKTLTPWSEGLSVTAGQYVSAENGNAAFQARANGTTAGSTPPSGQLFNDGGVTWVRADIMSLLTYLYTGAPTP